MSIDLTDHMPNYGRPVTFDDIKEIRVSIERLSDEVRACVSGQADIRVQLAKDSVRSTTIWAIMAAVGGALITSLIGKMIKLG